LRGVGDGVDVVIADPVVMAMMDVKIAQDEKTREPECTIPERVRNPSVQIIVIPGRGIVSDNGWTFRVEVVVD